MRRSRLFAATAALVLSLATTTASAATQHPAAVGSALSANDRTELTNYVLTDSFLHNDEALALAIARAGPCTYDIMSVYAGLSRGTLSLSDAIDKFRDIVGITMLERHHLNAREAVLGQVALTRANMEVAAAESRMHGANAWASPPTTTAEVTNLAFREAHDAEIRKFNAELGAIARQQAQTEPAAVFACFQKMSTE